MGDKITRRWARRGTRPRAPHVYTTNQLHPAARRLPMRSETAAPAGCCCRTPFTGPAQWAGIVAMPALDRRIVVRRTVFDRNSIGEPVETTMDFPTWATRIDLSQSDKEEAGGVLDLAARPTSCAIVLRSPTRPLPSCPSWTARSGSTQPTSSRRRNAASAGAS